MRRWTCSVGMLIMQTINKIIFFLSQLKRTFLQ